MKTYLKEIHAEVYNNGNTQRDEIYKNVPNVQCIEAINYVHEKKDEKISLIKGK